MSAKFVQEGAKLPITAVGAIAAGDVVVKGALVGVATSPILALAEGAIQIEGVFEFPKTGGSGGNALTQGQRVDWDAAAEVVIAADSDDETRQLGYVFEAAAAEDLTVMVKLHPAGAEVGSGS